MHKFFIFCGGLLFQFSLYAPELRRANAGDSFEIKQTAGIAGRTFPKAQRDKEDGKVILNTSKGAVSLSKEELAEKKAAFKARQAALKARMESLRDVFPKQDTKNDAKAIEEWDRKFEQAAFSE